MDYHHKYTAVYRISALPDREKEIYSIYLRYAKGVYSAINYLYSTHHIKLRPNMFLESLGHSKFWESGQLFIKDIEAFTGKPYSVIAFSTLEEMVKMHENKVSKTMAKEAQENTVEEIKAIRDSIWTKLTLYAPESEGYMIGAIIYDSLWDREDLIRYVDIKNDIMEVSIKKVRKILRKYGEDQVIKFDTKLYGEFPCLKAVSFKTVGDAVRLILSYEGEEEPEEGSDERELTHYERAKLKKKCKDLKKTAKDFIAMMPNAEEDDDDDDDLKDTDVLNKATDAYVKAIHKVAKGAGITMKSVTIKRLDLCAPLKYKF